MTSTWFALSGIVIPIAFLLSHASRWWGIDHAINLANYWVLWDFSYLADPGYRNDIIRMAVWIGPGDFDAAAMARARHHRTVTSGLDANLFQVVQEVPHVIGRDELQRDITLW